MFGKLLLLDHTT